MKSASHRFWTRLTLILILTFVTTHGFAAEPPDLSPQEIEQIVHEAAAIRGLDPARVDVLTTAYLNLPSLDLSGYSLKLLDRELDESWTARVDQDLMPLPDDIELVEAEAWRQIYGPLTPEVAAWLDTAADGEVRDVWIDFVSPAPEVDPLEDLLSGLDPEDPSPEQTEGISEELVARWTAHNAEVMAPAVDLLGIYSEEMAISELVPSAVGPLPAGFIRELADSEIVELIDFAEPLVDHLNTANQEINTTTLHSAGFLGFNPVLSYGPKIAVVEVGGYAPSPGHPFVRQVETRAATQCTTPAAHTYGVLGTLISTHGVHRGVSPTARVWAGGGCDGQTRTLMIATYNAISWGARMINHSYGERVPTRTMRGMDRFMDRLVARMGVSQFIAVGNEASWIGSPAKGFNVVGVGGYHDRGTANRADNQMYAFSNFRDTDSAKGDREQPQVVAPAQDIQTTRASWWLWTGWDHTGSGTSYASPVTMGASALVASRNFWLAYRPDLLKSILMTSATTNIEGDRRRSERDGAGGIRVDWADKVAQQTTHRGWKMGFSRCSSASELQATVEVTQAMLDAGEVNIRATLAWSSDPDYDPQRWNRAPSVDLDLRLFGPSGMEATSSSFDNGSEIILHPITQVGTYRLQSRHHRCDDTRSGFPLALSWWAQQL